MLLRMECSLLVEIQFVSDRDLNAAQMYGVILGLIRMLKPLVPASEG